MKLKNPLLSKRISQLNETNYLLQQQNDDLMETNDKIQEEPDAMKMTDIENEQLLQRSEEEIQQENTIMVHIIHSLNNCCLLNLP